MVILGVNAYHPDSSASIIIDGKLVCAIEEERLNRIKHWAGFPKQAIECCLREAKVSLKDIDFIAINRSPKANFFKKILFTISKRPSFSFLKERWQNILKIKNIKEKLSKEFSIPLKDIRAKIFFIEHHRAHLASSFFVSPFKEATIVSIDGFGDFTSCMVAYGKNNKIKILYQVNYPHSLGLFYTAFTQFLGFKKFGDEYKVMGLSAYGEPKYLSKMERILILKPNGRFELNLEYFSFWKRKEGMTWNNCAPKLSEVYSEKFIKEFGTPRKYEEEITQFHKDIASSIQRMYEKALFHILNYAYKLTRVPNLCLAGGCALNSLANGKIFDNAPFKGIYIQPASSDAGGSLGAGFYLYHHILNKERGFVMNHAYWGPEFSKEEIKRILEDNHLDGVKIKQITSEEELCKQTAFHIASGKVVGWFQGRMEWGPRALGNRSILADPRRAEMKDILNARIKKREWFRPFAPSILEESVEDFFEKSYPAPFMIKVYKIKKEKRNLIPAVTHIDTTGRLQTVNKEQNSLYWKLINEFKKLTGLPLVLNTSFNENEPIVCTPQQALDCFLRTKMDVLVLGNFILERE